MGFRPKRTPFALDFSGTEYEGLEVTVRPLPMVVMMDVIAAAGARDLAAVRHLHATFGYALESWNVEDDDGQPVPADVDGLLSQDGRFVNAVIEKWCESLSGGT
jgi:hypothetical protein